MTNSHQKALFVTFQLWINGSSLVPKHSVGNFNLTDQFEKCIILPLSLSLSLSLSLTHTHPHTHTHTHIHTLPPTCTASSQPPPPFKRSSKLFKLHETNRAIRLRRNLFYCCHMSPGSWLLVFKGFVFTSSQTRLRKRLKRFFQLGRMLGLLRK